MFSKNQCHRKNRPTIIAVYAVIATAKDNKYPDVPVKFISIYFG